MAKKVTEKIKEGVSVEEIEKFARKYTNEVFLILSLIIATISSIFGFFLGHIWSLLFAGLFAIIGIALPAQVGKFLKKTLQWQNKAEKTTIIIIGIVRIIFGIFIPFVLFAELGLLAGYAFHSTTLELQPPPEEHQSDEGQNPPDQHPFEEHKGDEHPPEDHP